MAKTKRAKRTHSNLKHFEEVMGITVSEFARRHGVSESTAIERVKRGYGSVPCINTHGASHPLYKTWSGIRDRCYTETNRAYKNYGARGIRMCGRWFYSFDAFVEDMGPRPDGYTLDRIDNDGDYSPENCRWASGLTQSVNKRNNSKYYGLSYDSCNNKWIIKFTINGKRTWMGSSKCYLKAVEIWKSLPKPEHIDD